MPRMRRNPNQFVTEEIQTATLIMTEGTYLCKRFTAKVGRKIYRYPEPVIRIRMCDKEALEPASRVFKRKISLTDKKRILCPKELAPRGIWMVEVEARKAKRLMERLFPLLTEYQRTKWRKHVQQCEQRPREVIPT